MALVEDATNMGTAASAAGLSPEEAGEDTMHRVRKGGASEAQAQKVDKAWGARGMPRLCQ